MKLTGPPEFIAERVAQRGTGYADLLEQAIVARGPDFFTVETDHPAYAELAEKFPPTAKELAEREAALLRRFHELWDAIHDLRDPTPEKLERITAMLPCGDCKQHWTKLVGDLPPDFASLEGYRRWTVAAHNAVNSRIGKPPMPFEEVSRTRRWT
jgi:hypothetical protein